MVLKPIQNGIITCRAAQEMERIIGKYVGVTAGYQSWATQKSSRSLAQRRPGVKIYKHSSNTTKETVET